jgi:hypothetical protein
VEEDNSIAPPAPSLGRRLIDLHITAPMKTRRQRKKKNKISSDTYSDTDDEIASALVRSTAAGAAVTTATLVRRTRGCGDDGGLVVLMTVIVPVVDNDVSRSWACLVLSVNRGLAGMIWTRFGYTPHSAYAS